MEQTRRHSLLTSLLGVRHLVICVNKMNLVDYDEVVYDAIRAEFAAFAGRLELGDVSFIPISALDGDDVVNRSANMGWYQGSPLMHHLETVYIAGDNNLIDMRFPVQYVIRPQGTERHDYRGYAGKVAGGSLRVGDEVSVLPGGFTTRIAHIDTYDGPVAEATPPMAVTLQLEDNLDISRGDMICRPNNRPHVGQDLEAIVCWMDHAAPLAPGKLYTLKHTTRRVRARVGELRYRLNIETLHRENEVDGLFANEVGRISIRSTAPLFYDEFQRNEATGSFILIDEASNQTVAGGMLLNPIEP